MAENPFTTAWCRVGVDLTPIAEVDDALERFGDRYATRLFTRHELDSCDRGGVVSSTSLAARFAAKEAVLKVLAPSGARPQWRDIEVRRRRNGSCEVQLYGRAAALAGARGVDAMSVSMSHEAGLAVAVVAATCTAPPRGEATSDGGVARGGPGAPLGPVAPHDNGDPENRRATMTITEGSTQRIRAVLAEHGRLPVDVGRLDDDDDLFRAGMTSHASVNVMLALEDAFDVEFPEAMLRKSTFSSIGSLRRALAELAPMEVSA
jgi:holo-[acyl-carrier protein] synthase